MAKVINNTAIIGMGALGLLRSLGNSKAPLQAMFVSSSDVNAELFLKNSYYYLSIMSSLLPLLYILWLTRCVIQSLRTLTKI